MTIDSISIHITHLPDCRLNNADAFVNVSGITFHRAS